MIYLGGAWPAEYRGQLFMGNIHGARHQHATSSSRKGSGYVGQHGPDFLLANDALVAASSTCSTAPTATSTSSTGTTSKRATPANAQVYDRTNGRIYKISYGEPSRSTGWTCRRRRTRSWSSYQLHANDWYVRHARRILQERRWDANANKRKFLIRCERYSTTTLMKAASCAPSGLMHAMLGGRRQLHRQGND